MSKVIIYTRPEDGGVSVIHPTGDVNKSIKNVPSGVSYKIVDADKIPTDREFRGAWSINSDAVIEDVTKAKAIAHGKRRVKRSAEFKPHDDVISLNIPGADATAAENARAAIRTKYATMQTNIDNASDVAGIKSALGG
tara:strand:+ start:1072 stop:1485 length:414 start_codon:yes stop_codon:yes gene_type:complete